MAEVKLNSKLRALLLMGCKAAGSYNPEEVLIRVAEQMTSDEVLAAIAFLSWVHKGKLKFGEGTIDSLWKSHQKLAKIGMRRVQRK